MQLTQRDLRLLGHVSRHRFLSSAQLVALDGGSPQNILRCLRTLFDHGYLDRPKAQLAAVPIEGPQPMVYGLGAKGARTLREFGNHLAGRGDWTEKNKRTGLKFLEHTLAIAEFMSGLEVDCMSHPGAKLLREEDILRFAPEATRRAREPLRWKCETVRNNRREICSVVPDGLFGLRFPDDTAAYFLLEVDRGTIPISRAAWHKSIEYKLATYYEGWRAGQHVEQFGLKQMRVVMVTNSAERMQNMLATVRQVTSGRGSAFFLFGTMDKLRETGPLGHEWTNGRGEMVRLTE